MTAGFSHRIAEFPGFVTLKRSDPARNMHRFYTLAVIEGLFAEWGVLREWGRVGFPGRVRIDWYPTQAEAERQCARLRRRKERKGYRVAGERGRGLVTSSDAGLIIPPVPV